MLGLLAMGLQAGLYYTGGLPLTLGEISRWVLAERLNEGALLYAGVYDFAGPLSAAVYMPVTWLFGRSSIALHLLSVLLVIYQCYLFNYTLIRRNAYNEKTYIPSLLYVALMFVSMDSYTLQPSLLGLTFLLLAARQLFSLEDRQLDQGIFFIGFYTAIAALFYVPYLYFFGLMALGVALFRTFSPRFFFLLAYGFAMPVVLAMMYYSISGRLYDLYEQYFGSLFTPAAISYTDFGELIVLSVLPGILLGLGLLRIANGRAFINFQINCQQLMFFWAVAGVLISLLSPERAVNHGVVLLPAVSFYGAHFLLLIQRRLLSELFFLLFCTAIFFVGYGHFYVGRHVLFADYAQATVQAVDAPTAGKKILVLGQGIQHYAQAQLATPYFNWAIAGERFDLSDYGRIQEIYAHFEAEWPEIIIDEAGIAPALFARLPLVAAQYMPMPNRPRYYIRQPIAPK